MKRKSPMNKEVIIFIKIILALFALNSITLYCYFGSNHTNHYHHHHLPVNHRKLVKHRTPVTYTRNISHIKPHLSKPWPIIPSYLPWSLSPNVALNSCEAYFGNGFTKVYNVLPAKTGSSWFRCHYSETLRTLICEGGKIKMNPGKIMMSNGGEKLKDVIGRNETEELPEFEDGAFEVEGDDDDGGVSRRKLFGDELLEKFEPVKNVSKHPMRQSLSSVVVVGENELNCHEWVEEPTLLVTRFEYANLFHTVTDWYSAYVASRVVGLSKRPHLVFVDGHCQTLLDETWKALFSSLRYAKSFTSPVCFRHAIFSPLGYETPLFKGLDENIDCVGVPAHDLRQSPHIQKTARLSEFGEMIKASFGLPVMRHDASKSVSSHNILFLRREDYLAHPRHFGQVEQRLDNEQQVFESLWSWASSNHLECKVNLINGMFARMPMKEQVRAIQDASVIIGAHGAGLTHIVSATPKTVLVEIVSSKFKRPHFQLIAGWKGLESHAIYLRGSYARPQLVIDRLNMIMMRFGC